MSALPKAVQAQLDQAEALQAQLSGQSAPEGNTAAPEVVEQPVEQMVPTEVQETQVTQQQAPSVDWEQRFRVLEGKYKAELPRLHEQNRELTERLENAIKLMETKAQEPQKESKLVTDADVETFGEDLVNMVRRASREEFDALAKKLVDTLDQRFTHVAEKVTRTEQRVVKSDTDKFWDAVLKDVPDFDTINSDQRWFAFLDAQIPGTRFTRRAAAENAMADLDAALLVEHLKAFKDSIGVKEAARPEAKPAKPKQNLNAQVAPSSSRASTPTDTQTGRIWSGQEYAAALDHRNLQRMSREEYEAGIAEAEQALAEGRVRF